MRLFAGLGQTRHVLSIAIEVVQAECLPVPRTTCVLQGVRMAAFEITRACKPPCKSLPVLPFAVPCYSRSFASSRLFHSRFRSPANRPKSVVARAGQQNEKERQSKGPPSGKSGSSKPAGPANPAIVGLQVLQDDWEDWDRTASGAMASSAGGPVQQSASAREKVDVWEGDPEQMTPEEEAQLLAEAERELEELQRQDEEKRKRGLKVVRGEMVDQIVEFEEEEEEGSDWEDEEEEDLEDEEEADVLLEEEETIEGGIKPKGNLQTVQPDRGQVVTASIWKESEPQQVLITADNSFKAESTAPAISEEDRELLREMQAEISRLEQKQKGGDKKGGRWKGESVDLDEDPEGPVKKRLPMEMRCFDTAKIFVRSGDGGNGVVAFRREKHVPFGGPSGGNGGRGGHVYFEVEPSLNSLQFFRKKVHWKAGRGDHGGGKEREGANGPDVVVSVPPGTLIRRAKEEGEEEGELIAELLRPGQRELVLVGGRGGRGNASFKSSKNRAPQLAEDGEEGREEWIELELKLVADVGIVGVPNAGKSTLLSVISAAKPKIANYPFTTLVPNLGVVELDYETMVFADVPGLLEGAHTGYGLGLEFLRHCERCRVLVHIVDGSRPQPLHDYEAINNELLLFNPELAGKPQIVAYNKMDIPEAAEAWPAFEQAMKAKGVQVFPISSIAQQNITPLLRKVKAVLATLPNPYDWETLQEEDPLVSKKKAGAELLKQKGPDIKHFTIDCDKFTSTWVVQGEGIERFTQMTNWEYYESMKRFQKVLETAGISAALKKSGVREGDLVMIGGFEFEWHDSEDWSTFGNAWERGTRGTARWPH